jgi:hypothetical protein
LVTAPIRYCKPATAVRAGDTIADRDGQYLIRRVATRGRRIYLDFGGDRVIEVRQGDVVICIANPNPT